MPELTLALANQLIESVFEKAAELELPPLGVAVLDQGAHLKALQCQDGLTFLRTEICQAKAWSALALGVNSSEIAKRYDQDDRQKGFIGALNAMTTGRIIALPGGMLLRAEGGKIIGAIGVAGAVSEADETCAMSALRKTGFPFEARDA